jgi:glutathione S-transferase
MTDITVYGISLSPFVRTVRMSLEEKGIQYDLKPFQPHSDEINARHPFGKVPAFRHGNVDLCETIAITTYIDEAFEGPALMPADPAERAKVYQWISFYTDNGVPTLGGGVVVQRLILPMVGRTPDEALIEQSMPKARKYLEVFDEGLKGRDFLAGKLLTLADLFPAPMIEYTRMIPEGEELLQGLSNINRWFDAIAARTSFVKTAPDMAAMKAT